jgi:hypothetical protein
MLRITNYQGPSLGGVSAVAAQAGRLLWYPFFAKNAKDGSLTVVTVQAI